MRTRHHINQAVTGMIAIVFILALVFAGPVQAKTQKVLVTTKTVGYSVDSNGNWYQSNVSTNKFNKKGLETLHESISYDEQKNKTWSYKYTYSYDKKDRTKVSKDYDNGKLTYVSKYTYKGSKTIVKNYDGDNKYTGKSVSVSKKNKYTTKHYDKNNKLQYTYISTWKKNKSTGKEYNAKNKLIYKWTSTYNKKGQPTKSESVGYADDGKTVNYKYTTTYKYKGGYCTSTSINKSGSYTNKSEAKYKTDKAGNTIYSWRKEYDSDGKLTSKYTYEYTKFTKGAAKGCIKQMISKRNGEKYSKEVYTIKQIKRKVN